MTRRTRWAKIIFLIYYLVLYSDGPEEEIIIFFLSFFFFFFFTRRNSFTIHVLRFSKPVYFHAWKKSAIKVIFRFTLHGWFTVPRFTLHEIPAATDIRRRLHFHRRSIYVLVYPDCQTIPRYVTYNSVANVPPWCGTYRITINQPDNSSIPLINAGY